MDDNQSNQTNLSFRDFPANPNGIVRRKLYKPASDLQFDLEMARRASKITGDKPVDEASDQLRPAEAVKSELIEFGLSSQQPAIDEQTLEQLSIPPPLKYRLSLERELRSDAIFIYNRSIALLKTEQIISHVLQLLTGRKTTFNHLEWVDDFSCVLAFASEADAIEAFTGLLVRPDEVEGENGLPEAFAYLSSRDSTPEVYAAAYEFVCAHRPAKPFSERLFEANRKNNFFHPTQPAQLIPFVRFATSTDVKDSRARKQSMFYALNGAGAGQEGVLAESAGPIFSATNQRRNPSLSQRASPNLPNIFDHLPAHPVTHQLPKNPLPKRASKPKVTKARPAKLGELDDELARFMTKTIEVKPSVDRTNRKREREEEPMEEEGQQESEAEGEGDAKPDPSPKRRMLSPSAIKPSVELLPDRPETCGGNLRDEIFEAEQLITDFQDVKPKPEVKNEAGLGANKQVQPLQSEDISTTDDAQASFARPLQNAEAGDQDQNMTDVENPSQLIQDPTLPTSDIPPRVPKPEPKTRGGRWGPLFSRLF
ncbi:hypothetical protein PTTG_05000 [Puccinia triticina 1-1 BBBD Race 1]|uniref:Uncharacterized protein n=1 Tax=Puccinia triticina (isolate 1-1 / race 1 (BBBD)) TaxID=630390 RepID=A0A180GJC8_PUCT1|nr:hypothetical protein PTTG_05000 [Puccinia triticina 1-1 BBBD Race 1]